MQPPGTNGCTVRTDPGIGIREPRMRGRTPRIRTLGSSGGRIGAEKVKGIFCRRCLGPRACRRRCRLWMSRYRRRRHRLRRQGRRAHLRRQGRSRRRRRHLRGRPRRAVAAKQAPRAAAHPRAGSRGRPERFSSSARRPIQVRHEEPKEGSAERLQLSGLPSMEAAYFVPPR